MIDRSTVFVCYPGGSGGSFIAAALHAMRHNKNIDLEKNGSCHFFLNRAKIKNFVHDDTIESLQEELLSIQSIPLSGCQIFEGHYRNLPAIKEHVNRTLGYEASQSLKFVKISVDPSEQNEIKFIAGMLRHKANSFPEMSLSDFETQTEHYVRSWYWIENFYTRANTIEVSLSDIFVRDMSIKFDRWLQKNQLDRLRFLQNEYKTIQNDLYPDLIKLLGS